MLGRAFSADPSNEEDLLPTQEDYEAVVLSVRDYAEGWYDGDQERMRRCLHPDLVKRTVVQGNNPNSLELRPPITFDRMVDATREGGGTDVPRAERRYQIDVLDIFRHMAIAPCVSPLYMDYVQLAKFSRGRWLIVNVLWEVRKGIVSAT